MAALRENELVQELPPEKMALVKEKMTRLHAELLDGSIRNEEARRNGASVDGSWPSRCRRSRWTRPARKSSRPQRTRHGS